MIPGLDACVFKPAMVEIVFMLGIVIRKYSQKSDLQTTRQAGHGGHSNDDVAFGE